MCDNEIFVVDLFCGGGGATRGIVNSGVCSIVGVDINADVWPDWSGARISGKQPCVYGYVTSDAITVLQGMLKDYKDTSRWGTTPGLAFPDLIWASPPCQAYTWGTRANRTSTYPDMIAAVRDLLVEIHEEAGTDYIIENVPGSPLIKPVRLCGEMFGINVLRHRHFECSWPAVVPPHQPHKPPIVRPRRDGKPGNIKVSQYCCVSGHGGNSDSFKLKDWQDAMGIDWMARPQLIEAIPPIYAEYLVTQWRAYRGI